MSPRAARRVLVVVAVMYLCALCAAVLHFWGAATLYYALGVVGVALVTYSAHKRA